MARKTSAQSVRTTVILQRRWTETIRARTAATGVRTIASMPKNNATNAEALARASISALSDASTRQSRLAAPAPASMSAGTENQTVRRERTVQPSPELWAGNQTALVSVTRSGPLRLDLHYAAEHP